MTTRPRSASAAKPAATPPPPPAEAPRTATRRKRSSTVVAPVAAPAPPVPAVLDVLMLTPTPIYPADQGNRKRIDAVCKALRASAVRLHLVYYPQEWWFEFLPLDWVDAMRAQCDSLHVVPVSRHTYNPPAGEDYTIDEWWDDSIATHLQWLFKRQHFDAFIVNYAFMSKAFEYCPKGVLRILDTHDQFTGRRALLQSQGLAPEFFYTTEDQEVIALKRADVVWAIKDEERDFYRRIADTRCITLPHGEPWQPAERQRRAGDNGVLVIGMLGSGNIINVRNAEAFIAEGLPLLRESGQAIVLRLVGAMCQRLEHLRGTPGLELLGPVDEVEEFYRDVDVVIVPLAFGTGLKIKAVEAFSRGMPIVAMAHAMEGIPVTHPWHRCDTMQGLAQACVQLAREPARVQALRASARQTHDAMQSQVQATIAATLAPVRTGPLAIVVLASDCLDPDSLTREHLLQTVNLLRQHSRVVLYVDDPLPSNQLTLFSAFNSIAGECKLVVSERAQTLPGRSLGMTHVQRSLADLLAQHPTAVVWALAMPPALRELQAPGPGHALFARRDVMRLRGEDCTDQAWSQVLGRWPNATLVDDPAWWLDEGERPAHVHLISVPFWRWKPWRLSLAPQPQTLWLLVPGAWLAPAQALAELFATAMPGWRAKVVYGGEGTPAGNHTDTVPLAALMAAFTPLRELPVCAVNLVPLDAAFDVLTETLLRAKVPVVEVGSADRQESTATLRAAADTLTTLVPRLPRLTAQVARRVQQQWGGSEVGWSALWSAVAGHLATHAPKPAEHAVAATTAP